MPHYEIFELLDLRKYADARTLKFHQNAKLYGLIDENRTEKFNFQDTTEDDLPLLVHKIATNLPVVSRTPHSLHYWSSEHRTEQASLPTFMLELMRAEATQLLSKSKHPAWPSKVSYRNYTTHTFDSEAANDTLHKDQIEERDSSLQRQCPGVDIIATDPYEQSSNKEVSDFPSFDSPVTRKPRSDSATSILDLSSYIKAVRTCETAHSSFSKLSSRSATPEVVPKFPLAEVECDEAQNHVGSGSRIGLTPCQLAPRTSYSVQGQGIDNADQVDIARTSSQSNTNIDHCTVINPAADTSDCKQHSEVDTALLAQPSTEYGSTCVVDSCSVREEARDEFLCTSMNIAQSEHHSESRELDCYHSTYNTMGYETRVDIGTNKIRMHCSSDSNHESSHICASNALSVLQFWTLTDDNAEIYSTDNISRSKDDAYYSEETKILRSPILDHNPAWGSKPGKRLAWKDTSARPLRPKRRRSSTPETQSPQQHWKIESDKELWSDVKTEVETRVTLISSWLESLPIEIEESLVRNVSDAQHAIDQPANPAVCDRQDSEHKYCADQIIGEEALPMQECGDEASTVRTDSKPLRLRCSDLRKAVEAEAASRLLESTSVSGSSAEQIE